MEFSLLLSSDSFPSPFQELAHSPDLMERIAAALLKGGLYEKVDLVDRIIPKAKRQSGTVTVVHNQYSNKNALESTRSSPG